jgi:Calcineurin-like phosphoesterase
MFSSGNHEAYVAPNSSGGSFLAYRTRVAPTMPGVNASGSPFWHSWNYGRIHFLAFDVDQTWTAGSPQYNFIVNDLKNVDRKVTPWVFAYNHFPLMCSNAFWCLDGSGTAQAIRALYEPIFNAPETRVHLYLSGHVHAAEIMYPVATGSLTPTQTNFNNVDTIFQVMAGFPGDEEVCCNDWQHPIPAYSAWRMDDVDSDGGTFGFSTWTIKSDTELTLQMWNSENRTLITSVDVTIA